VLNISKRWLALYVEVVFDGAAQFTLNFVVTVHKTQIEPFGQMPTHRCFARSRHADNRNNRHGGKQLGI
jgi:hypothetical protein